MKLVRTMKDTSEIASIAFAARPNDLAIADPANFEITCARMQFTYQKVLAFEWPQRANLPEFREKCAFIYRQLNPLMDSTTLAL
jgi:hypothetical protein